MAARLAEMLVRSDDKPATAAWATTMHAVEKNIRRRRPNFSTTKMVVKPPSARHICKQAEKIRAELPEYPSVPSKMDVE